MIVKHKDQEIFLAHWAPFYRIVHKQCFKNHVVSLCCVVLFPQSISSEEREPAYGVERAPCAFHNHFLLLFQTNLWRVDLDGVVDVYEDEEESDKHRHPARDHLRVDEEADPGDDNEEAGGEVVRDDVEAHLAGEDQLEARRGVVHPQRHVVRVLRPQRLEGDPGQHRIRANVLQIHNLD